MNALKAFIMLAFVALLVAAIIDMSGPALPEPEPIAVSLDMVVRTIKQADEYAKTLREEGYCEEWAHHKAYVEYELLPVDSLYISIEQD